MDLEKKINRLYSKYPFINKRFYFFNLLPRNSVVLDYGCGNGFVIKGLLESRGDISCIGVDTSDFDKEAEKIKNFKFRKIDINAKLPFESNTFDGVTLIHVLEHIPEPINLIKELNRVLKPGGMIYIESPASRTVWLPSLLDEAAPLNFFDDYTHIRPFSKKSLMKILKHSNLKAEKIGIFRNWLYFFLSPILLLLVFVKSKRNIFLLGVNNLIGWSVYGIGKKK